MKKKLAVIILLFTVILSVILAQFIWGNYEFWQQIPNVKVFKNGEPSLYSRVYLSNKGEYLINFRDSSFESGIDYIIYTKPNNLGVFMSSGNQPYPFPFFALVPKDRGNIALASNEKLLAKLNIEENRIEIRPYHIEYDENGQMSYSESKISVCFENLNNQ